MEHDGLSNALDEREIDQLVASILGDHERNVELMQIADAMVGDVVELIRCRWISMRHPLYRFLRAYDMQPRSAITFEVIALVLEQCATGTRSKAERMRADYDGPGPIFTVAGR